MILKKFINERRGNIAIMGAAAAPLLMGAMTLAIDYSNLTRHKSALQNSLDASCFAAAVDYVNGAPEDVVKARAQNFFVANLGRIDPATTKMEALLPGAGQADLNCRASLDFKPYFFPILLKLINSSQTDGDVIKIESIAAASVRLRNTVEVALVLDNSGSMDFSSSGNAQKRIKLLKDASKNLVSTLSDNARRVIKLEDPIKFAVVPFAGSVNVGSANQSQDWMDTYGLSPIHHENFDWSTDPADPTRKVQKDGYSVYRKVGPGWGSSEGGIVSRFTLYKDMKKAKRETRTTREEVCIEWNSKGCKKYKMITTSQNYDYPPFQYASWQGCVESRPWPYNVTDQAASASDPETLFVPMFAPDEADPQDRSTNYNNWWSDSFTTSAARVRQNKAMKYYQTQYASDDEAADFASGPNQSCTTAAITPLTKTDTTAGETAIKNAIDKMEPLGATNVTEGLAWGMRVLSSQAPFTEAKPEINRANDKFMIVLTDGANTYYTPESLGRDDPADNGSTYSAYGYTKEKAQGASKTRIFQGTTAPVSGNTYTNANYSEAMIQHTKAACENAKAAGITIFTVALDLDYNPTSSSNPGSDAKMAEALKACASPSKVDPTRQLFWNTRGGQLDSTFKAITEEISNLRMVG